MAIPNIGLVLVPTYRSRDTVHAQFNFLANVNSGSRSLFAVARLSVCLSVSRL